MFKSRKTMAALLVVGVLVIAGTIAVAGWAHAAPAATASAAPAAQVANVLDKPHIDMAKYADLLVKSFEGHLNIDDAKLNAAFAGAVSATLDQAVKDGLVTSAQAAQVNTFAKDGVTGLVSRMKTYSSKFGARPNGGAKAFPAGNALSPASLAAALNMSSSDLETELKSGKSLADIAKEHHVDLQTVKNTVLAKAKSALDSAVSSGALTQSEADQMMQGLSQKMDMVMSSTVRPFAKSAAAIDHAKYANLFLTAFESQLGIDDAQLNAALTASVAEVSAQAVKDGAITTEMAAQANSLAEMGVRQLASLSPKTLLSKPSFGAK